jgi:glucokinase
MIDGQICHGASDGAGEVGHTIIEADGRRCRCGNYGCLEAYASGPAIAARAIEALESGGSSNLAEYVAGDLSRLTARTVYQAARDGDQLAGQIADQTARALGAAIASLINLLNPEVVVICGGVAAAGDRLFEPLKQEVARRAFRTSVAACRIVPGQLQGTAGVYGAARAFLDQCPEVAAEPHA